MIYSSCTHSTFYQLCKVKKCSILLGSRTDLDDYVVQGGRPKLIVDLSGSIIPFRGTKVTVTAGDPVIHMALCELAAIAELNCDRLAIEWDDRNIPTMDRKFWDKFVDILKKINGPVFIHCVGGHGRTGALGAILVGLLNIDTKELDPISFIRKEYCQAAVESDIQCWYVEVITGLDCADARVATATPVSAVSKWQPVSTSNQWSGNSQYHSSPYATEIANGTEKFNPSHNAVLQVDREMYDDLNWDTERGYIDSMGEPIGENLAAAIATLKARKEKAV